MAGLYRYQLPAKTGELTGQTVLYGDPTINKEALNGATFLGQEGNPNATDPLLARYTSAPGSSTTSPTSTTPGSGVEGAASAVFGPGGAYDSSVKPYTPAEEQAIRDQETAKVQAQIDAIRSSYLSERSNALITERDRSGRARATAAASGVLGSPTGNAQEDQVQAYNDQELQAIEDKKNAAIQSVLAGVENRAKSLIDERKQTAGTNAEKYLSYLSDVATKAKTDLTSIASSGVTYQDLLGKDPVGTRKLLDQAGLSEEGAKALFISNAPKSTILNQDKPIISADGSTLTYIVRAPNGTTSTETIKVPSSGKTIKDVVSNKTGIYVVYTDGSHDFIGGSSENTATPAGSGVPVDANGKPIKLSTTAQESLTTMSTIESLIKDVNDIADKGGYGIGGGDKLPGVGGLGSGDFGTAAANSGLPGGYEIAGGDTGQQVRDKIANIKGTIAKLRGGTSFTPNEEKLLNGYTPNINDTDSVILQKLKDLSSFIDEQRVQLYTSAGAVNAREILQGGGVPASGGTDFTVDAPDGQTYTFPDQESLDAFKQAAGIQ